MIERTLSNAPNVPVPFFVLESNSGRFVASVGFHPEIWGKGLVTSLCAAAVRWAFEHWQWVRVQATTLEEHAASQRVLLKGGFRFEEKLRNFRVVRGEPRDHLLHACMPTNTKSAA